MEEEVRTLVDPERGMLEEEEKQEIEGGGAREWGAPTPFPSCRHCSRIWLVNVLM